MRAALLAAAVVVALSLALTRSASLVPPAAATPHDAGFHALEARLTPVGRDLADRATVGYLHVGQRDPARRLRWAYALAPLGLVEPVRSDAVLIDAPDAASARAAADRRGWSIVRWYGQGLMLAQRGAP